jgi:predicted TIM-barrel enzyme
MIHLKGSDRNNRMERMARELDIYRETGIDGIIVENYFGDESDVEAALDCIRSGNFGQIGSMKLGVNVLGNDRLCFGMAVKYSADFLQLDSVAGHLPPDEDEGFHQFILEMRSACRAKVFGGIRFKYQPYKSGRSLAEDMGIGQTRCDAVVVTQDATGQETSMEKITEFRGLLGRFPLIAGAGMTPENCARQLAIVDGAIVGSYFKDTYEADGEVCAAHCASFMKAVLDAREGGNAA